MSKKIALRYCGGCNPQYERGRFVKRLQAQFPELELIPFDPEKTYQGVLVICGCTAQCASQGDLPANVPRFVTATADDYERAAEFLLGIN